jgi:predicted adenine nucleotide alpha hydrolase (AANH) superfamily ATPase
MYSRKLTNYDFFKPLNQREQGRLKELWIRAEWLKQKMEQREKEFSNSSNLYRKEYSATLWAFDYINAHNKKIVESNEKLGKGE